MYTIKQTRPTQKSTKAYQTIQLQTSSLKTDIFGSSGYSWDRQSSWPNTYPTE